MTLSYRFFDETASVPALAIAGEIKFPTAGDDQIGTGKTDYTAYVIASKRSGKFDFHANAGFTYPGSPHGVQLDTTFNYAAAVEYHANDKWDLVAEVFGNTSSAGENADTPTGGSGGENTLAPEVSNGETIGSIGARYHFREHTDFTIAVSADNNNAWIFAPGFTIKF